MYVKTSCESSVRSTDLMNEQPLINHGRRRCNDLGATTDDGRRKDGADDGRRRRWAYDGLDDGRSADDGRRTTDARYIYTYIYICMTSKIQVRHWGNGDTF